MDKINFENAEIFFQDFPLGKLASEIAFQGYFTKAILDGFTSKNYAQVNSPDIILHFPLKEKSPQFMHLLQNNIPIEPSLKHLFSEFGTLKIITENNISLKITEAFWTRFPLTEFQIKHNQENMIHSLYFLW